MYKFKNNFIYFISRYKKVTYILNCKTNDILEIDSLGTDLIEELLTTDDEKRAKEIIGLFEECDFFEKRNTGKI